jgi:chaperone required for assembly of F1-ATPase
VETIKSPLQKAQVLTQRRKAAKILKKTFDLLKQQISNQFHFFTQFLIFFAP